MTWYQLKCVECGRVLYMGIKKEEVEKEYAKYDSLEYWPINKHIHFLVINEIN